LPADVTSEYPPKEEVVLKPVIAVTAPGASNVASIATNTTIAPEIAGLFRAAR
jgi:hypothetical protein